MQVYRCFLNVGLQEECRRVRNRTRSDFDFGIGIPECRSRMPARAGTDRERDRRDETGGRAAGAGTE